jgi:monoamine oxidase
MTNGEYEVVVIGGGAAGIGAARRLHAAGVNYLLIEARSRLGGRAFTMIDRSGRALDNGCGWLHSADRNPWNAIAAAQGKTVDRTRPPWERPGPEDIFPAEQHREFWAALRGLFDRAEEAARGQPDQVLANLLPENGRWNAALNAASTYISGAELDRVSVYDTDRYADTGVNWRVLEGYGATVAAHGEGLNVALDCAVTRIDHIGRICASTPRRASSSPTASSLRCRPRFWPMKPCSRRRCPTRWKPRAGCHSASPTNYSCRSSGRKTLRRTFASSAAPIAPAPAITTFVRLAGR